MTSPWLTVVIPTHNGARWLGAALQSVVDQDDPGITAILIDSSETHSTLAVAESFVDRLDLRIEHRPDMRPWTAKTNLGVREARTEHVCLLHQDDTWLPGRASAVRHAIAACPNAAMHIHAAWIIDPDGQPLGPWRCPLPEGGVVPAELLIERLIVQNFVAIPSPTIRRDAFLAVGGMDEALWYTSDWDLYLKLADAGPVTYDGTARACFRVHGSSQTVVGSRGADFVNQLQRVLDRHGPHVPAAHRAAVLRAARASIMVNKALAAANNGHAGDLGGALLALAGLGPVGLRRYLRDSRIVERTLPRLKVRFAGRLAPTQTA
jgi:glycosyltransferase involved in cell wall biosynthesis